jgi:hypothetical protein
MVTMAAKEAALTKIAWGFPTQSAPDAESL